MNSAVFARLRDPALLKNRAYIDGEWVSGASDFAVMDPATDEALARVPNLDERATQEAIQAANKAWPLWRRQTAKERANTLRCWFQLMLEHADDLAVLITAEQGKPLAEAQAEVMYAAAFIEWFAEQAKRIEGDVLESPAPDRKILVIKQSVGVCAAITPWNFPLAMITRKVAPALAAGCPIVIKPAEQTPLCALALAELAQRAGLPNGVFNVVTGDAQNSIKVGRVLCESTLVRHLSFTGSTVVGRALMQQCAPNVKRMSLELGGHAPFIVFDDADLEAALEGAMASKYRNAGQTCICANIFYVHEKIHDTFVEKLSQASRALKVGNGFETDVKLGPLIDQQALEKVMRHIQDAQQKGAQLMTGGNLIGTRFITPTVLTQVTSDMLIAREETFGPVAAVLKFRDEEEVIQLANDSEFGLAAYFYSRDMGRIWRVAEALEYGMVGINTTLLSNEVAPFGGVKQSGFGREGSKYGLDEYLEIKYLAMGGL